MGRAVGRQSSESVALESSLATEVRPVLGTWLWSQGMLSPKWGTQSYGWYCVNRGFIPTRAPCLLPEEMRVSRPVGEGMGCVPQWRLLVTVWGSRAGSGEALEAEGCRKRGRVEAWSVLVLAAFSKDHCSRRCRSEDLNRCRQRWWLSDSSMTCTHSAGQRAQSSRLGRGSSGNPACFL